MKTATTPSSDSHPISITATPAPPRRGRPRVHANDSAKKAAYRQRKLERKIAAAERANRRLPLRTVCRVVERDLLTEAKNAYLEGKLELALALFEQHEAQGGMAAYDEEIVRQERRTARPVKHNRACRGKSACLCGPLTMSRGMYLTDAPQGCGKLVSGGYDSNKVALISDTHQIEEECGGSQVGESGWSSDGDAKTASENRDEETDCSFMEKRFQDSSWLKCYVAGCIGLPWAILLEPEDYDGSIYYCCDLHCPTRVG
jgi:hypothetical protein